MNLKTIWRFIKNITYSWCSKVFSVMAWNWGQNRSLHFISCVFLCEVTKGASNWWNYRLTRKSNNTWKKLVPVCPLPTFSWTRNKNDVCLKHMTSSTLVKCNSMIISVVMPSYPNVTLLLCYISEHWTTARTLDMTINHKIP